MEQKGGSLKRETSADDALGAVGDEAPPARMMVAVTPTTGEMGSTRRQNFGVNLLSVRPRTTGTSTT